MPFMVTLNLSVLQELKEFMDEEEFREFIQDAHDQLKQQGEQLLLQMARANWASAQHLAHRLKGTMGSLGCEDLHVVLQILEAGFRETPAAAPTPAAWDALEAAQHAALVALRAQLSGK